MLLAGDIGGTKTLLGLFESAPPSDAARGDRASASPPRLRSIVVHECGTRDFADLPAMIAAFLRLEAIGGRRPDRACFGLAGPVAGDVADLTNVPWRVDAREIARAFDLPRVALLNDLQAMAAAVPVLEPDDLQVLQAGRPVDGGTIALIAAGTGLGEALLHRADGRYVASPSEGGHADFAARGEREFQLVRALTAAHGRASVEDVLSGRGFVNLHKVAHQAPCEAAIDLGAPGAPAAISAAGLARRCAGCAGALEMFVEAYGAEAGNLALRAVATGGVYVGGGIAPKIRTALASGPFIRAFNAKPPMEALLRAMPVSVILNAHAGLLGAAVRAAEL
ncbi:MAG: glucokinase [Acidobacteria bacterium]|nr:glucokinase [Acidobacteriota bacterium]